LYIYINQMKTLMKRIKLYFILVFATFCLASFSQQASITIKNKSERYLTVKLMKGNDRKAAHYKTDSVAPKATQIIYITETGQYFTKTQAILFDKKDPARNDTIYNKDRPFLVLADNKRGYRNITIEFVVEESKKAPNSMAITRKEYKD